MYPDLAQILSISDTNQFHRQFERHFRLTANLRTQFDNNSVLLGIRRAFIFECAADAAPNELDKIYYYYQAEDALKCTRVELTSVGTILSEQQNLFLCHALAKVLYQQGTCWMQVHDKQSTDSTAFEHFQQNSTHSLSTIQQQALSSISPLEAASLALEQGYYSYESFHPVRNIESNIQALNKMYDIYHGLEALDPYSPWSRLIALSYNYFLCAQENERLVDQTTYLETRLTKLILSHKDPANSPSTQAIAQVEKFLEVFKRETDSPTIITSGGTDKLKKKRRLKQTSKPMIHWLPSITNRSTFNASFTTKQAWTIPDFLRPRQKEDMATIFNALPTNTCPMIVTKPTGTGKTAEFSALTNAAWQKGLPTIIVVPTVTLVEQTYQKLIDYSQLLGMDFTSDHFSMFCPTKQHMNVGPITIVTQASYVAQAKKAEEKLPTDQALREFIETNPQAFWQSSIVFHPSFYSLLIVDEGHHADGKALLSFISRSSCQRPKVLFSASTIPGQYPNLDNCCQHIITQELKDAIQAGELAPFQSMTLDFSMYAEARQLTRSIRQRLALKGPDAALDEESKKEISEVLCRNGGFGLTALSVLEQISKQQPSSKKVMIFTDSIDHANQLAELASCVFQQKIDAFHTKAHDRDGILENFKANRRKAIVAVGALDEGFDDPNVNLILDFSIYKSRIRRMIQRLGRALRLRADGSGAILVSIKLLPKDLQLIPRDEIIGEQSIGYLGLTTEQVLSPNNLTLTLPQTLELAADQIISPQGAALVYPADRRRHKLGTPPESEEHSHTANHMTAPSTLAHQTPFGFFENPSSSNIGVPQPIIPSDSAPQNSILIQQVDEDFGDLGTLDDIDLDFFLKEFGSS